MSSAAFTDWKHLLRRVDRDVDDAERITQIRGLEELKSAAAAAQARVTADFAASQRARHGDGATPVDQQNRSIGAQVALARRDSPHQGSRHLGLAQALTTEMPHTLAALQDGRIGEWRATIMVKETACLTAEDRTIVDTELGPRLGALGDAQTGREARRIGYRLDVASVMARIRGAVADRRVTIRPAPDTMSLLTGLLPAKDGIAAHLALRCAADRLKAAGDPRSRGQIMADTLVQRLTGQSGSPTGAHPSDGSPDATNATNAADATGAPDTPGTDAPGTGPGIEIGIVMTDQALFGLDDTPADLTDYGPIPAALARQLIADTTTDTTSAAGVWVRRLYTDPDTGALVAMDSRRRTFSDQLRKLLITRDQFCRTPWCNAPIRHLDHIQPAAGGGCTTFHNGQGLCQRCNHTKQAPGWQAKPGPQDTVTITTPTGHTYTHHPPPQPAPGPGPTHQVARASPVAWVR